MVEMGGLTGGRKTRKLIQFQTGPRRLRDSQAMTTCQVAPTKFQIRKFEDLDDKPIKSSGTGSGRRVDVHVFVTMATWIGFCFWL